MFWFLPTHLMFLLDLFTELKLTSWPLTQFHMPLHAFNLRFPLVVLLTLPCSCWSWILIAAGVPLENILYLGGPNIASEIYNKEYANARICGADKWRKPLAKFLRQPHFIVWDNSDLITHEVMGGLKNIYAIGAGKFLFAVLSLNWLEKFSSGKMELSFGSSLYPVHEILDEIIPFFSIEPIKLLFWHRCFFSSYLIKYAICIHWMLLQCYSLCQM